jgi:hypothetical protein
MSTETLSSKVLRSSAAWQILVEHPSKEINSSFFLQRAESGVEFLMMLGFLSER